jgi:PAS domain S-box-containing protein
MASPRTSPTGREVTFAPDEIIVSKTDLRGVITYANDVFLRVAGYAEAEVLGQPHNLIRHPGMPRCVFRLLWDTLQAQREIFAYVVNMTKTGDAYWVFAHVTPSYDLEHRHVGYHSNRRVPYADALPKVKQLYAQLLAEESRHTNPRAACAAGLALLQNQLSQHGTDYDTFVFSLSAHTCLEASQA